MADEMEALAPHAFIRASASLVRRSLAYASTSSGRAPARITSLIRSHSAKTRHRQGGQLMAPHVARLRKSMQQQDRWTRSGTCGIDGEVKLPDCPSLRLN